MNRSVRQVRVRYEGEVQGVGFRYAARGIANQLGVTGGVENLNDGAVQLVGSCRSACRAWARTSFASRWSGGRRRD